MQNAVTQGFRLSPQQQHLWRVQRAGHSAGLVAQCAVDVEGPLDRRRLHRSLERVVERQEILRTTFHLLPGMTLPVQVVGGGRPVELRESALEELAPAAWDEAIDGLLAAAREVPFDLAAGPLLRAELVLLGPDRHTLLLSLPALVADGASLRRLAGEIAADYAGTPADEEILQYADAAEILHEWLDAAQEDPDSFWRRQDLTSLVRPARAAAWAADVPYEPRALRVPLDGERLARIESLAGRLGAPVPRLLLAVWQAVIARSTGEGRVVVGTAFDGRTCAEFEPALGPFGRVLPVAAELSASTSLRDLAAQLETPLAEGAEWQDGFPLEAVDGLLAAGGQAPSWELGFDCERLPVAVPAGDVRFTVCDVRSGIDRFSLRLSVLCSQTAGRLELQYDPARVQPAEAERLLARFERLLDGALAAPDVPLAELDVLGEEERRELLVDFNRTDHAFAEEGLAHELFAARAQRDPQATAVISGDLRLSYGELDARANRLAHHLRALGAGPGSRVGLCLPRSVEMVEAILGALKAGVAYVPLDPGYPAERLAFMAADAGLAVLLTTEALRALVPASCPVIRLDAAEERAAVESRPVDEPVSAAGPDDLAYVIYTSGSTGRPKGVMVPHRGLANYLRWARESYPVEGGAPVHSPVGFDLTVTSLLTPLAAGAAVTLLPEDQGVGALAEALRGRPGYGLVKITPAHLEVLRQVLAPEELAGATAALVIGGEALWADTLAPWRQQAPATRLINEYGPTEATVGCCVYEVAADDPATGAVPIGRPIANTRLYVMGPGLQPVPAGAPGELWIGGDGLARGYLGRPDVTAERFVPAPFAGAPGARLYRTGDLVRHRPDGDLEYLGRIDDQVKIRGFRIEPGEIEAVLAAHPAVREAAVVAREEQGGKRLVAFVVPGDERPAAADLRAFLGARLPDYMVPAAFVALDALPLTANGKLDRRALPATPEREESVYAPPRTLVEELLAEIWARVLGVEKVGIDDPFFSLGGDSIRSIQVLSLAQERGISLTLQDLFQSPTIRGLAGRALHGAEREAEAAPFSLVAAADRPRLPEGLADAYPLSRLQAGMVFHSAYSPGSAVYNDLHSFNLRGRFDAGLLRRAVAQVARRHAALRTAFDLSSFGEPLQLVHAEVEVPVDCDDLRGLPAAEQAAAVEEWLERERRRGFDWAVPPLVRFHVHRRAEDSFQFTLSFHHSVLDGWSAASLLTELFRRYTALLDGEVLAAEPPTSSLREFVALERATTASEEAREFWRRHLDGSSFVRLPRRGAPAGGPGRAVEVEVPVPVAVSDGLKALARAQAVPVKSVLLAAHFRVLSLLAGQPDVLSGVVANGRPERADGDQVLGLFLNTLPLRLRLGGGTWEELARAAFELERESLPFRRFPLADLQRMEGGRPLFEIAFNFLHYHVYQGVAGIAGLEVLERAGYEETNFLFTVHFQLDPRTSHVHLLFNYQGSELAAAEVAAIGRYYQAALAAMAAEPGGRYETASLLPPEEREQLLAAWNGRAAGLPTTPIHRAFERQAAARPEAVALTFEGRSLTYGELNARANRLARRLRAAGAGPEVPVAVALERSLEMVVALLAILKAGGAYVPLDPAYPEDRLAFILADTGAPLLVTSPGAPAALPAHAARVVPVDAGELAAAAEPAGDLPGGAGADDLAYIIYTSGSTGRPKGVQITHAHVSRLLAATDGWFGFGPEDVWTLFHSYAFDFSVWEIWGALLYGGRLVVVPHAVTRSPAAFHRLLASEGVTVLNQTPSAFRQLAGVEDAAPERARELSLRAVVFGGEALDVAALRIWIARHGVERPRLVNMYGITETTVHVTYRVIAAADLADPASPIGVPIPDLRIYLLDPHGQPVPPGVPGEIHVGGDGVARGYLRRPELTAERFVPDPFGGVAGARLYRSGDLARHRSDGGLEYLGRADDQVKIRGFRIELGEIEAALLAHPGLREAVVLARADAPGERRLAAYVVPAPGARPAVEEILAFLRQRLPEHMLPSAVLALDALPLTPNGKVDRRALPAPGEARPELAQEFVAARGDVEAVLCRIWAEVLRLERVGVHDNFFALGGDSILSIQITTRAQREGVNISPRLLFQHPTVAELAAVANTAAAVRAEQGPVVGPLPLTPIQRWFFAGEPAEPHHYNQSVLFATARRLAPAPLAAALARLADHHDALRLRFRRTAEGWEQQGIPPAPAAAPLLQVDLSALPAEILGAAIDAATAEAQASLDLAAGPLQRALLIDLGADRPGRLFWTIHHLVVDGVSWRILLEDLAAVYGRLERGEPAELPAKTTSYRRWSEALSARAQSPELASELPFWLGLPWQQAARLPLDGDAGNNPVAGERTVSLTLEAEETRALLQEVPQAYGTQINEALLTALARALQPWTGSAVLLVDLEGHGREEIAPGIDLSRTVGWFTSIYPVLLDLRGAADPGAALREVKESLRRVPGGGLGFGLLRHLSPAGGALAGLPRAEMSFNYLGQLDQALPGDGPFRPAPEAGGPPRSPGDARRHLLDWSGSVFGGRLHLSCTYGAGVHRRDTVERLVAAVAASLRELIAHCRAPEAGGYTPSDFPLAGLDQSQLDKVLALRRKKVNG